MSAGETEEIEQEVESVAEILRKPATESVQLDQVSTKLAELLEKDAIHKGEASRQFRGLVRKLLPVSIVSRLGDVRTAGLAAAAGPMIARMASTIAIMAIGDSDVTETLGARGAVPELLHSLTPSLRKQLKLEGQKAVMEAVSVLTISNEDNRLAVSEVEEVESENGCQRVVACMLETAKADPVSPTAFQAARLLRNLSYSEGTPLRWQLHSAGAMEAVETLLSGVRAAASAVAGAAGEAGATPQAGVVLPHNDAHHSIRFQALQALALIYGAWAHDAKPVKGKEEAKGGSSPAAGDETDAARRASEILKKENMVDLLCGMLHAIVNDQGSSKIFYGIDWSLGPWSGPLTCRVMATNGAFAVELAEKGAVELLSEGLTRADAWKPQGDKPLSVRGALDACKALLYMLMIPRVQRLERIVQARPAVRAAVEALRAACESERFYSPEWAQTVDGILGQLAAEPPAEGADAEVQRFDVFLSHKRSDSADFTRGLYNFLSLKGFKCFLDFEFRDELNDLAKIVANSTNFVFVLTDNIFESPWCMIELESAVRAKKNIVLVVKEGSRWANDKGLKVCDFPPYSLINQLKEEIRPVFTHKAIGHSNEYYGAFCDLLVQRLRKGRGRSADTQGAAAAELPPPTPSGGGGGVPLTLVAELREALDTLRGEVASLREERKALMGIVTQLMAGAAVTALQPPQQQRDAAPPAQPQQAAPPGVPTGGTASAPPAAAPPVTPQEAKAPSAEPAAAAGEGKEQPPPRDDGPGETGASGAAGAAGPGARAAKALRGGDAAGAESSPGEATSGASAAVAAEEAPPAGGTAIPATAAGGDAGAGAGAAAESASGTAAAAESASGTAAAGGGAKPTPSPPSGPKPASSGSRPGAAAAPAAAGTAPAAAQ